MVKKRLNERNFKFRSICWEVNMQAPWETKNKNKTEMMSYQIHYLEKIRTLHMCIQGTD